MNSDPFKHRYFGGISSQRRAFLEAERFEAPPKSRQLKLLLTLFKRLHRSNKTKSPGNIWIEGLTAVRGLLPSTFALNLLSAIGSLVGVLCVKAVLDQKYGIATAMLLCFVYLITEFLDNSINSWMMERRATLARAIQAHLLTLCNSKLLRLDRSADTAVSSGNLKTLIASDVESVEDFLTIAIAILLPALFLFLVMTPLIYFLLGWVGLLGIALALSQVPISIYFASYIERSKRTAQTALDQVTTLVGEWVRHIRLIRYLGWQGAIKRDIATIMKRISRAYTAQVTLECGTYAVSNVWWTIPILGMLAAWKIFGVSIDLASFFASLWALTHLTTNSIQHIPFLINWYAPAAAGCKRLKEFLELPEVDRLFIESDATIPSQASVSAIILQNVSLVINDRLIIKDISAIIKSGEKIGIVGEVGSGKSILLDLLSGERRPSSGDILIEFSNGIQSNLWNSETYHKYRSQVAACWQIPFLSNNTIERNIDLGDQRTPEQITSALQSSQLLDDIKSFPKGIKEEVGEIGINLSGGQKQRVSLARAFISKREILILDDPLSAVDRRTERALSSEILSHSKLLVMSTHRLDGIEKLSRVIVLEDGKIIEDSPPTQLLQDKNSQLFRLYSAFESEGA